MPAVPIRRLPPEAVNRIAAGEVVERPAAAVKELVENALDAGARRIRIAVERGGIASLTIEDDGNGIAREELPLAVERHATSKLAPDDAGDVDLLNIFTMGFRGEALPSIGAVARLSIASRARGAADAWRIEVEGGAVAEPRPTPFQAVGSGTVVAVRDLFYATPARLKFLKSERAEAMAITETIKRLAMARAGGGRVARGVAAWILAHTHLPAAPIGALRFARFSHTPCAVRCGETVGRKAHEAARRQHAEGEAASGRFGAQRAGA